MLLTFLAMLSVYHSNTSARGCLEYVLRCTEAQRVRISTAHSQGESTVASHGKRCRLGTKVLREP